MWKTKGLSYFITTGIFGFQLLVMLPNFVIYFILLFTMFLSVFSISEYFFAFFRIFRQKPASEQSNTFIKYNKNKPKILKCHKK